MLIVKTCIKQSDKGIGLFALQKIQNDQKIIQCESTLDRWYYENQVKPLQDFFCKYGVYSDRQGAWYLFGDNARFIRHNRDNPNLSKHGFNYYATRDIAEGEEITADYYELCDWVKLLGLRFRQHKSEIFVPTLNGQVFKSNGHSQLGK